MLKKSPEKPVRNRIDLSTEELARHWCKRRQRRNCYESTRQVKAIPKLSLTAALLKSGEVVLKHFLAALKRF